MGEVAQAGQYAVPDGGAQEGVKRKRKKLHVGDACRNRNKLADDCNQSAYKRGNGAVFTEVVFGFLNLAYVQQQEMSKAAVGELIDNRAAQELGQEVVDVCPYECAYACGNNNQYDAQA